MLEAIIICASVVIDQLTKLWASSALTGEAVGIIPGIINFRYVENRGMAFGLFQNGTVILAVLTGIFICVMVYLLYRYKSKTTRPFRICLSLIIGGAVGNLIDRIFAGFVVDFIEFDFVNFAVFNFADICVTVGAAALLIYLIFFEKGKNMLKGLDSDGRGQKGNGEPGDN